jgi:hypothetical protein
MWYSKTESVQIIKVLTISIVHHYLSTSQIPDGEEEIPVSCSQSTVSINYSNTQN